MLIRLVSRAGLGAAINSDYISSFHDETFHDHIEEIVITNIRMSNGDVYTSRESVESLVSRLKLQSDSIPYDKEAAGVE